jgi:pimeloyl-ACP methyl ester carboxylesterase
LPARPLACTRPGNAWLTHARRHPRLVALVIRAGAPTADRAALDEDGARERAAARFLAAAGSGVGGMVEDYVLCTRPWGFAAADVRGLVQLWHGMQDPLIPVDHALGLAAALPNVQTALDPDEGHFFYRRRLREILGNVAAACRISSIQPTGIEPVAPGLRERRY